MIKHLQSFITVLALSLVLYLGRYILIDDESVEVDEWLNENELGQYKQMFREHGEYIISDYPCSNLVFAWFSCTAQHK